MPDLSPGAADVRQRRSIYGFTPCRTGMVAAAPIQSRLELLLTRGRRWR